WRGGRRIRRRSMIVVGTFSPWNVSRRCAAALIAALPLVVLVGLPSLGSGCAQGGDRVENCSPSSCSDYCRQQNYGWGECVQEACLCHYSALGQDGGAWHPWNLDGGDACGGCPEGQLCCGGVCKDVEFDPTNCGLCDRVCAEGEQCVHGWCKCGGTSTCYEHEKCCDGQCVNLLFDPTNCGDCGVECKPETGPDCVEGQCVCPEVGNDHPRVCAGTNDDMCCPRRFLSSGGCVDLGFDREHCGSCSKSCDYFNGETCFSGQCVLGQNN
ncbi:MAG: hypothetical protein J7M25_09280, partial [Deltaproteobacteria bacterium]|nr:hypothetical protein [Deltaproteobacteria bacterium]